MVYPVSEDSLFFAQFLENYVRELKNKDIKYCDMGSGSGILAEAVLKQGVKKQNILCVDIDTEAVNGLRKKGFNAIKSDLFDKVKEKFDLISFNAPYLPQHEYDNKKDTTGGKKGDETALRFIKQAKKHIKENGKIFVLVSSLTPLMEIKKHCKFVARKKLFFEELLIFEVCV